MITYVSELNIQGSLYLNNLLGKADFLDVLVLISARYIDIALLCIIAIVILFLRTSKKEHIYTSWYELHDRVVHTLYYIATGLIAWVSVLVVKYFFVAPRPYISHSEIEPLFIYGGNDSFPSGHATLFAAVTWYAYSYHKPLGIVVGLLSVCIMMARIIAGIHYPFDILVGIIFGICIAEGVKKLQITHS